MASPDRSQTIDLNTRMREKPFGFDFFRAVRLLEAQFPDAPRVGESITPRDDRIRFKQMPSLAFAASTLHAFEPGAEGNPMKLWVNFAGLFGPNGPMPLHVTEFAHERQYNARDSAMVSFFDLFHQRMLSLFYRAWAVNQKTADMDRPAKARFAEYIGSLFGIGMETLRNRDAIADWAKLYFSGRLAGQTRHAEGLGAIIQEYFGMPTLIQTFCGHWMNLPASSVCRLGETPETGSLGVTAIVGSRFWDSQLKFRVRLGPMALADLSRMLPAGDSFTRLKCWVLNYVGEEFFWDVQLVLKAAEVPSISLGQSGQLGWTSWLKSVPFQNDAEDLILNAA